ncbi:inactive protein RESTRICTED TEV MOVEMENT 2-like [Cucurbita moschata]|uniref:Inactive protein RESTRICTED TEV MOVEMENT 2-like n=1 Tax=Cucurbita moschata TaxID=3662 RepID=A0A6J1H377_CUCMO|nr:inactive protein RESTRICTED TEV MOVEMENT 2-like [Cucurbita moschata]
MAPKNQPTYEDFEPLVEASEEDGCSILSLHVPGFRREQIRVQVSSTRKLRISGERPYQNKTWQRFHKEFEIPSNCTTSNITAKYKDGILHVRQPLQPQDVSEPPRTAAPNPPPPQQQQQNGQQQAEEPEKKSSPAANGKAEAKSNREREGSTCNGDKISGRAGRLKEVAPGLLGKFILPVLAAVLLFLLAKRLDQNMAGGAGESRL